MREGSSPTPTEGNRAPVDSAPIGALRWITAVSLAVACVALLQLALHVYFMRLPMLWYHVVATALNGVAVSFAVVLYLRWRSAALATVDALERLRASEALREDMAAMLIHDLKNPLAASLGGSQVLLRRGSSLGEDDRRLLNMTIRSQTRLLGMIENLLGIARAEAGDMPVNLSDTDLGMIARVATEEAQQEAEGAGVSVSVEPGTLARARCDEELTRRVVANLLANAIRFTPEGGRVTVSLQQRDGEALITVRDTGPGIAAHLHEAIFDKFEQAQASEAGHRGSVGLGLAFCRLAVEAQGGRIWADSRPGEGSAFTFSLPLYPQSAGTPIPSSPGGNG